MKEVGRYSNVSVHDLSRVAEQLVHFLQQTKVWLFMGELGAGKTTFIKAIGEVLGVEDAMSSPSFAIVNEYHTRRFGLIYHFDFYRIKSEVEAFDIGVDEYFDSGSPCFLEWPEKIPSLIPDTRGEVHITIENESLRTIAISVHV